MSAARCSRLWMAEAVRDGRLKGAQRDAFLRHLKTCPDCTDETALLESVAEGLRRLPVVQPDPLSLRRQKNRLLADVDVALMDPAPPGTWPWRMSGLLALAACIATTILLIRQVHLNRSPPLDPTIEVNAEPGSKWYQTRGAGLTRLVLDDGSFTLRIRRTSPDAKVLIDTPDGEIEDRGTVLSVTAAHGRTKRIAVDEGQVAVRFRDTAEFQLRAGQSWDAPTRVPPGPEPTVCPSAEAPRDAIGSMGVSGVDHRGETTARRAPKRAAPSVSAAPLASADLAQPRASSDGDNDAEDQAYLQVVHLLQAGGSGKARLAARDYLIKFPNGFRRVEMLNVATGSVSEPHP
jgi:hypothetical protein